LERNPTGQLLYGRFCIPDATSRSYRVLACCQQDPYHSPTQELSLPARIGFSKPEGTPYQMIAQHQFDIVPVEPGCPWEHWTRPNVHWYDLSQRPTSRSEYRLTLFLSSCLSPPLLSLTPATPCTLCTLSLTPARPGARTTFARGSRRLPTLTRTLRTWFSGI
jgi:hypothetical protein